MITFPTLRTGAAAQYPLQVATRFRTQSVEFLDGSRQTFALQGKALRQWEIQLDLLDDAELAAIASFMEQVAGATFLFTDPVSGETSIRCVLADSLDAMQADELRASATLSIREVV